jgi:CheY-like chemotaxis protein
MAEQGVKARPMPAVLLVDDEAPLLDALAQELGETCRITTASSAAEADLRLAARRYDVIVCDHMLPGEQGLEFLARALELMPSTRRILVTGYTSPEFISRSVAIAGLSACLVKPVRASEIAAAIKAALSS